MNDNLIVALYDAIAHHPELRVGQLIVNAARLGGWHSDDVFSCPDDTILFGLAKMSERHQLSLNTNKNERKISHG